MKITLEKGETKVLLGHVSVDSGQVIICDPCYIDDNWKQEEFKDIRRYKHKDGTILQYLVDFPNYAVVIPKYGKTMNQLNEDGDTTEMSRDDLRTGHFSYDGVCQETLSEDSFGEVNINFATAVATRTKTGDGNYPVYGIKDENGSICHVFIDFENEG
jgi:hypothetical protein